MLYHKNVQQRAIDAFSLSKIFSYNKQWKWQSQIVELPYCRGPVESVRISMESIKKYKYVRTYVRRLYRCLQRLHGVSWKHRIGPFKPLTILCFAILMYGIVTFKCTTSKLGRKNWKWNKKGLSCFSHYVPVDNHI